MSKVVKGIKKVFKKVVKVVKKIAVPVLAAAALVFTGGAALGLPGIMGAGWGAAASAVGSTIGGSGVIGSVLTGAITQAGSGALIGGAISAASGGSFSEGAKAGAVTGAVTGGAGGLIRGARGAFGEASPTGGPSSMPTGIVEGEHAGTGTAGRIPGRAGSGGAGGSGGLLSKGGWLERNQRLVGNVIGGLGQGLLSQSSAEAEEDLLREQHRLRAENYRGTDPGREYRPAADVTGEARDPMSIPPADSTRSAAQNTGYGNWEFRYDPRQGRIVRVARDPVA